MCDNQLRGGVSCPGKQTKTFKREKKKNPQPDEKKFEQTLGSVAEMEVGPIGALCLSAFLRLRLWPQMAS